MDCNLPGSTVHGISQARILECVAISFSRGSSRHKDWTWVSWLGRWILYHRGGPWYIYMWVCVCAHTCVCVCVLDTQSCSTLCNPVDCSLRGFSFCGILWARIPKCIAIPFSRGTSRPRYWTLVFHIVGRFFTIWATGSPGIYVDAAKYTYTCHMWRFFA